MKSILIWLFVFTLGSIAANIPTDKDNTEIEDASVESSEEQSSDPALSGSMITKRGVGLHKSGRVRKLNHSPVCFGARHTTFGTFYMPRSGKLAAVKLVHLYGFVSCDVRNPIHWSFWGCGHHVYGSLINHVNVVITTRHNGIILPPYQFMKYNHQRGKWSKVPGYNSFSPEIVLSRFYSPYRVYSGQQLRVWYGEDLMDYTEWDNGGRVCCDVYGIFV